MTGLEAAMNMLLLDSQCMEEAFSWPVPTKTHYIWREKVQMIGSECSLVSNTSEFIHKKESCSIEEKC